MTPTSPPSADHETLVTVVVLNWNGQRLLPDCLDALAKQDLDPSLWQVWVVDNGSTDGSLDLLARDYPDTHVIRNGENLGYAGGNNVGLRAATTPFVVLLNNDAHPEPDWLRRLLAAAQDPEADQVAAISSKVLFEPRFLEMGFDTPGHRAAADPRDLGAQVTRIELNDADITEEVLWDNGSYGPEGGLPGVGRFRWTQPTGSLMLPVPSTPAPPEELRVTITAKAERPKPLTLRWPGGEATVDLTTAEEAHDVPIPPGTSLVDVVNNVGSIMLTGGYGADRGYQEVDTGQYDQAEDVFLMCGCAVILRNEALQEVGVFDDDFFMYYEDTDLSWRLRAAGWSIRYAPEPVVRHLHSASSVEWSPFFTFHVERNRLLMLAKSAPAGLAARQFARFNLTTASMIRRSLLQGLRDRRRPAVRPLLLRFRVIGSYLGLLPKMLTKRRRIAQTRRTAPAALLDRWMLAKR